MEKKHYYTDERNAQIVIALLKAYGIKRVIASPGSTHMNFLGSIQYDPYFQIWSAVDERHAAFMAVGMAAETGEPVVITCTGSSASRNYLPALTEAFYRKLPVLAITGSQVASHIGNLYSQAIDRTTPPKDSVKYSLACPMVYTDSQARDLEVSVNRALLELTRHGGGPVHLNLETMYDQRFSTHELPRVRRINRFTAGDELPTIPSDAKIAIFIANHKPFTEKEQRAVEMFLLHHNAVAVCDVTSSWRGSKMVAASLLCAQGIRSNPKYANLKPDLLIHIGEMCNDYPMLGYFSGIAPVWRVNEDGEVRDRFGRLENVFEMAESFFFSQYAEGRQNDSFYREWKDADDRLRQDIPDLPFSNLWMAQQTIQKLPKNSFLYVGLSTTLQSWNACLSDMSVQTMSNVGTCGIDGVVSTLAGASVASPEKLLFGVVGDLTFFYDMNALGNRHIDKNFRLLLVNNGTGGLFHAPGHIQEQFTDCMDPYMAAGGHFGCQSKDLVRNYVQSLGFKYLTASNKEEYLARLPEFVAAESDRPIVFECFTRVEDDSGAWGLRTTIDRYVPPRTLKGEIKKLMPQAAKNVIKSFMR